MEQKQRRFTKNVFVLDQKRKTLCGQIAGRSSMPYCQVKIGRNFALKAVSTPEPKGYVLEINDAGAYRIQDGNDVISMMLSADSVEATQERWEEWKFETISCVPMATVLNINGAMIDAEIKISKGMGMVAPYTRNDFDRRELPELPGVQRSKYDVRELRQKIREEREKSTAEHQRKPAFKPERWLDQPESDEDQGTASNAINNWVIEVRKQEEEAERFKAQEARMEQERKEYEAYKLENERRDAEDRARQEYAKREREKKEKKKREEEEIIVEEEEEESGEEETQSASYITLDYVERLSKIRKSKDERLSMLASMMPQQMGEYSSLLFVKKTKWDNVPLYLMDEMQKKYELQSVGSCERVAFVSKGTNLIVLPVGV
uniref:Non-structural protein NS2 n=1 Tax=Epizootic hemorrhagic disease virus (serotype 8 / strain CPR 3961A) TaxID=449140 RepID=C8TED6_9REOV|nr:NS2 protein [Epizootic hemorrhagic disease virus (serotype 8 / strain CPR 3961A)]